MLTKPLTHLRPLLRLPSHSSPSPEHFSSNPSLLHHLPHNPTSSLVSATQSSTQAAGQGTSSGPSGAGSGRAGWGAGTGNKGGYTGHARAFLSLQQNATLDPSSSITLNSDERRKEELIFKHRLGKSVQVVQIDNDTVGRNVSRSIEARSTQRVAIVDLDRNVSEERLLEGSIPSQRRSSIIFPSNITPYISTHPSPRRTLPRSQSSADIWHVGVGRPRDLSIRQLSTKSSSIPLPLVEAPETNGISSQPTLSTRVLGQPNRVLMDLAGIDLPGRPAHMTRVRRNSTAAIAQHRPDDAIPDLGSTSDVVEKETGESDRIDRSFFSKLAETMHSKNESQFRKLAAYYRSARTADAFNITQVDPSIKQIPLPSGYTTATYNACLEGVFQFRQPGESIAPILEIYNEMIDRDCIPNGRTYGVVIKALCQREQDIADAVQAWEEEKKWTRWTSEKLGLAYDQAAEEEKDRLIQGYKSEGNFDSALKLHAASVMMRESDFRLRPPVYRHLLQTAARIELSPEQIDAVEDIIRKTNALRINGNRRLRGDLFLVLARAGRTQELDNQWTTFREADVAGEHRAYGAWLSSYKLGEERASQRALMEARAEVWVKAAQAYARLGQIPRAIEIHEQLRAVAEDTSMDQHRQGPPRPGRPDYAIKIGMEIIKADYEAGITHYKNHVAPLSSSLWQTQNVAVYLDAMIQHGDLNSLTALLDSSKLQLLDDARVYRLRAFLASQALLDHSQLATKAREVQRELAVRPIVFDIHLFRLILRSYIKAPGGLNNAFRAFLTPVQSGQEFTPEEKAEIEGAISEVIANIELTTIVIPLIAAASEFITITDESIILAVSRCIVSKERESLSAISLQALGNVLLAYPADEPEVDDALLVLAEQIATTGMNNHHHSSVTEGTFAKQLAQRLTHRFGQERAHELMVPISGANSAEIYTQPPSVQREAAPTLPPLPEAAPAAAIPEQKLHISPQLGSYIDRHTHRKNAISVGEALRALQQGLSDQSAVPHPDLIARLLDNVARAGQEGEARQLYSLAHHVIDTLIPESEKATAWRNVENHMLIATCHMGYLEEAGMYRARIIDAGMVPSADAYGTMISSSKDTTDDALVARELFEEAGALGVRPSLFLYNVMLSKLSKARKAELAIDLFKSMKMIGMKPSSVTYGAVINACCRVGDEQSAVTLFEEMSSQPDFNPRVPPFNIMMQFYLTSQPSRERVLHYYNEMRRHRVPPTAHTYKLLLDAYAVLPPIDLAAMEKVFNDLSRDRRVGVQGTHWASVINAYGINNDPDQALRLFDSLVHNKSIDLRTEPVVWEAILSVVARLGTVDKLDELSDLMHSMDAKATAYVYNALIGGYARAGRIEEARKVYLSMGDSITGVAAPNNHPQLLTSSGHVKPNTVTSQPTKIIYREPSTYESMVRAELSVGNVEMAEAVLEQMSARRYPIAVFMRTKTLVDDFKVAQSASSTSSPAPPSPLTPSAWEQPWPKESRTNIYDGKSESARTIEMMTDEERQRVKENKEKSVESEE